MITFLKEKEKYGTRSLIEIDLISSGNLII
jgi:hypothetical protein